MYRKNCHCISLYLHNGNVSKHMQWQHKSTFNFLKQRLSFSNPNSYFTLKYLMYLPIIVKGHELDGSIRKYPDHHRSITLIQATIAFFLWHSFESWKHSCRKKEQKFHQCGNKHLLGVRVWQPLFYLNVCNGGSGLEEESWLCPEER